MQLRLRAVVEMTFGADAGAVMQGVLRLGGCFASRTIHSAQDDNSKSAAKLKS
jgi:hypothetical protein